MNDVGVTASIRFDDVASAARSFNKMPDTLLGSIESVTENLLATRAVGVVATSTSPLRGFDLRQPNDAIVRGMAADGELGTEGTLVKLLAQLRMAVGSASIEGLNQRLAAVASMAAARAEALGQLSTEIDQLIGEAEKALAEAELLTGEAAAADVVAKRLREHADRLASELAAMDPSSPDYAAAASDAASAAEAAGAQEAKAMAALGVAASAVDAAQRLQGQIARLEAQLPVGGVESRTVRENQLSGEGLVTALLGKLHALISEHSSKELEQQGKLIETQIRAAQQENAKRIKEYEAELAKAEQLERKMGSWAKAIGWAIVAVSLVAGVVTGGATLAFAGVGLAMMIADEVMEKPFISGAIGSVIETVLKPVMDFFGGVITDLLKALGVDEDTARMIGAIGGALLAVVAVALVVILGKGAAANLMSKVAGQLAKVLSRIVPDAAKSIGKSLGTTVTKTLTAPSRFLARKVGDQSALAANYATVAAPVAQLGVTVAQGVGNVVVADKLVGAARIAAELEKAMANNRMLTRLMELIVEAYTATGNTLERTRNLISDVVSDGTHAATQVVGNIRK